ncbi:MAG: N-acetylmuramic acid 6-phosphate etherase [Planctomycetota bacterium]
MSRFLIPEDRGLSRALTEASNPRSARLDRMSPAGIVRLMLDEESHTVPAVRAKSAAIARAAGWIAEALRTGGRLFYVGAGTSGRLGILDAAECPPTFGTRPDSIQGVIAGGPAALRRSKEGAEDRDADGRREIRRRKISARDVVAGITAGGSTPFVLGALREARRRGARVVFITCNPRASFRIPGKRFLRIAIATGPEIIAGSTRLKAGTATKIVLNLLSTTAMVRMGRVRGNLMAGVSPSCGKLRERAARILSTINGIPLPDARRALARNGGDLGKLLHRQHSE